jgi:hypothetical protein
MSKILHNCTLLHNNKLFDPIFVGKVQESAETCWKVHFLALLKSFWLTLSHSEQIQLHTPSTTVGLHVQALLTQFLLENCKKVLEGAGKCCA